MVLTGNGMAESAGGRLFYGLGPHPDHFLCLNKITLKVLDAVNFSLTTTLSIHGDSFS